MPSSQLPGAGSVHPLVGLIGLNMWSTVLMDLPYPLRSEFPLVVENLFPLTSYLVFRFPNPVPPEIRVPYWATLDVTVCFKVFFSTAPK